MADEDGARLDWLNELLENARRQLDQIEQGWRYQICIGTQTRNDVTAEVAERARRTIEQAERLLGSESGA
jgi:hypothetical protein